MVSLIFRIMRFMKLAFIFGNYGVMVVNFWYKLVFIVVGWIKINYNVYDVDKEFCLRILVIIKILLRYKRGFYISNIRINFFE